jgi:hypothetical protein
MKAGVVKIPNVNPAEMTEIAQSIFASRIQADMGSRGVEALKRLLPVIRNVHLAISTERLTKGLRIICALDGASPVLEAAFQQFITPSELTAYYQGDVPLTVQVVDDGLFVWTRTSDSLPEIDFVAYAYHGPHSEVILTRSGVYEVPVVSASPSYFGIPYFRELRQSMQEYGSTWIKNSVCEIFNKAWLDDKRRVFAPGPEIYMRRSLQRHLRSGLRELSTLTVMPEQNVNETRPVDIKVTWGAYNRVALIEIKWLGKSVNSTTMTVTQNFSGSRAKSGASQLADYLDSYRQESPNEETRGYLVVYDARRRNNSVPLSDLSVEDAAYYRYVEIDYDAEVLSRPDFEVPLRFFCESVVMT